VYIKKIGKERGRVSRALISVPPSNFFSRKLLKIYTSPDPIEGIPVP
jgi:hypothetical protein